MFLLAMLGNTTIFVFCQFIRELLIVASLKNSWYTIIRNDTGRSCL